MTQRKSSLDGVVSAPIAKAGILEIKPYVGGKAGLEGRGNLAKLSANENALGASEKAVQAYRDAAGELHRYPEGGSEKLREAIAAKQNIPFENIVCGAGSDELISLISKAYAGPGDEVLYSAHGFLMYKLSALACGAQPVAAPEQDLRADVDALLERVTSRTRIVFLANPNNPTGSYLSKDEIRRLHAGLRPDIMLVIDGAYAEFVELADYDDGVGLALEARNVVATRTFSKIHGLAALRLGWMVADAAIIDIINRIRGPFNVSVPAQRAGVEAILDDAHVEASKKHNDHWLAWLTREIEALGLQVYPSVGNFVLIRFQAQESAGDATVTLPKAMAHLEAQGVIPRDVAAYGLPDCLRISIGTEVENRLVVDSLKQIMT